MPLGPAIQPSLAFVGVVAVSVLLAVEPREEEREDKGRLSSPSLSSKPRVLKTHIHRGLQVKTDT